MAEQGRGKRKPEKDERPEEKQGRKVDLGRVNEKLAAIVGQQAHQVAMLESVIEEQDELVAALRAELVEATSGGGESDTTG